MPKVGIVMGSDSDLKVMSKAAKQLEKFGIDYEMTIISAHREPDVFFEWAKAAEGKGIKVIIAGAGMAAHLPGMCAALFPMPVIGVPLSGKNLDGMDALYSIVQMPPGIPVATVAIDGGMNAAILAAKILSVSEPELLDQLKDHTKEMKETVQAKASKLDEIGYEHIWHNENFRHAGRQNGTRRFVRQRPVLTGLCACCSQDRRRRKSNGNRLQGCRRGH